MHQGHAIPWAIISKNFKLVKEDKRYTPPYTGFSLSTDQTLAQKELKHFIRKFVSAITTFSDTERKKYPTKFPAPTSGKLFSDEILRRHPEFLNEQNQRIEYWIAQAERTPWHFAGGLAGVIKVLLYENEMETLLMLAHHPRIPVGRLCNLHWGHQFGFLRVMRSALRAYLFFNTAEAVGVLDENLFANLGEEANLLIREISDPMDYPAQQIPHRLFLQECGILDPIDKRYDLTRPIPYPRLQAYLKELFALLYRYDVFARECKIDTQWDKEMVYLAPFSQRYKPTVLL